MTNLELLKTIYQGFLNGNMDVLFSNLAEEAIWKIHSAPDSPLPAVSIGADEIKGYFQALDSEVELRKFDIKQILDGGDTFAVLIDLDRKYKSSGAEKQGQYVHIIKFNEDGQLASFDGYEPSA
ncbi:MAG: nuclear transport factor 2 family protein [Saprospiraceae bacterium]|nr:nuclear transport factor 2 family protein [Saprospiraceae bacterium]